MSNLEFAAPLETEGEWRIKYRELCHEFDTTQRLAGELRAILARLLSSEATNMTDAEGATLATLRDLARPLEVLALKTLVDRYLRRAGNPPGSTPDWLALIDALRLPEAQTFAVRHLRTKAADGRNDNAWVLQLAGLINECALVSPLPDPSPQVSNTHLDVLSPLLDWLVIPPDFDARADRLRETLKTGESPERARELGTLLNEIHSSTRQNLRSLGEYLKGATCDLRSVEMELQDALQGSQQMALTATQFTTGLDAEVEAIDRAINGDVPISELKMIVDAHVRLIRTSVKDYMADQRTKRIGHEQLIGSLAARIKKFEQESEKLRVGFLNEQRRANHDALTGLPNRLAYEERSLLEFQRARRNRTELTLAVIDIDLFKTINDNFGHKVGDKVLRHIAELCQRRMRKTDLVARFGGEEFVALFPDTPAEGAREVCEDLRTQVERACFEYQSKRVPVTISIGLAGLQPKETLGELFERADTAMYAAKRSGRNKVHGP